jgi:TonB family protein
MLQTMLLSLLVLQTTPESACAQVINLEAGIAASEVCLGEEQRRLAEAEAQDPPDRRRRLEAAARHYRRAANATHNSEIRSLALDALATLYGARHLDQLDAMDHVLRELIALKPDDLVPLFRLARLHEDRSLIDAAEDTLLSARRLQPENVEPYKRLAQFYARRATAVHRLTQLVEPQRSQRAGEPDERGIYRIGGGVTAPRRLDRAEYPPDALASGIEGAVVAEVVISEKGEIVEARIVRSVPLLDEAALEALRYWYFAPTLVNGEAVPVSMTVTVNFTKP